MSNAVGSPVVESSKWRRLSFADHLLSNGDDTLLLDFTLSIHGDERFPTSDEKHNLTLRLLTAAVKKAVRHAFTFSRDERNSFLAFRLYVEACFDTECEGVIMPIVDTLTNIENMSPTDAQQRAVQDIIPLASYCAERTGGKAFPGLRKLQDVGLPLYLDWLSHSTRAQSTVNRLTDEYASMLLKATVVDGDPDLLMSM